MNKKQTTSLDLIETYFSGNVKNFRKFRAVFNSIRWRCGRKKGYKDVEFKLGNLEMFCKWLQIQGGYKPNHHVCRIGDRNSYTYDNIVYLPQLENLRHLSKFYFITDLIEQKQVLAQQALCTIFKDRFDLAVNNNAYKYVDSDKLFKDRFKIITLTF